MSIPPSFTPKEQDVKSILDSHTHSISRSIKYTDEHLEKCTGLSSTEQTSLEPSTPVNSSIAVEESATEDEPIQPDIVPDQSDSSLLRAPRWRYCNNDGQEMYVNEATDETWIPAKDERGKTYYYEMNSRYSVWELDGCDLPSNHSTMHRTDVNDSDAGDIVVTSEQLNLKTSLPTSLVNDNVNEENKETDGDNSLTSSVSDDNSLRSVTPKEMNVTDTSLKVQMRTTNKRRDKELSIHSTLCTDSPIPTSGNRPLSMFGLGESGNKTTINITKQHISGPKENKLTHFEKRCMVEHTAIMENHKTVSKKWQSGFLLLSCELCLIYKDEKAAIPKANNPFGKPLLKLNVNDLQITDADTTVTKRTNVLKIEYHVDGKLFVRLIQIPNLFYESWKAAFCYAKQLVTNSEYSVGGPNRFIKHGPSNKFDTGIINKLLEFFRNRPSAAVLRSRGILKNESVFGSTISQICKCENSDVPNFVVRVIRAIEARGLEHVGIYRMGGDAAKIQQLRYAVNRSNYVLNTSHWDIDVLTGALKLFFRELKEPLVTFKIYPEIAKLLTHQTSVENHTIPRMRDLLRSIPVEHFNTFRVLFHHLYRVMELSDVNQMKAYKLAIVFGPSLIWPEQTEAVFAELAQVQVPTVLFLLEHIVDLFGPVCPPPVIS